MQHPGPGTEAGRWLSARAVSCGYSTLVIRSKGLSLGLGGVLLAGLRAGWPACTGSLIWQSGLEDSSTKTAALLLLAVRRRLRLR